MCVCVGGGGRGSLRAGLRPSRPRWAPRAASTTPAPPPSPLVLNTSKLSALTLCLDDLPRRPRRLRKHHGRGGGQRQPHPRGPNGQNGHAHICARAGGVGGGEGGGAVGARVCALFLSAPALRVACPTPNCSCPAPLPPPPRQPTPASAPSLSWKLCTRRWRSAGGVRPSMRMKRQPLWRLQACSIASIRQVWCANARNFCPLSSSTSMYSCTALT